METQQQVAPLDTEQMDSNSNKAFFLKTSQVCSQMANFLPLSLNHKVFK
jgi:hypothetical protein